MRKKLLMICSIMIGLLLFFVATFTPNRMEAGNEVALNERNPERPIRSLEELNMLMLDPEQSYLAEQTVDFPPSYQEQFEQSSVQNRLVLQRAGSQTDIYFTAHDGATLKQLTSDTVYETTPNLQHGSDWAAFSARVDNNYDIYKIKTDGTGRTQLTSDSGVDVHPEWSPDQKEILFESNRTGNYEIYLMNGDGTNVRQLTSNLAFEGHAVWSPDGSEILFVSDRTGLPELWRMNGDGSNQHQFTFGIYATYPAWDPQNEFVAFTSDGNGDGFYEIWQIGVDGVAPQVWYGAYSTVTDYWRPSWSADGAILSFVTTGWIFYQGNWYWTESLARAYTRTGSFTSSIAGDNNWWINWSTIDNTGPTTCSLTAGEVRRSEAALLYMESEDSESGIEHYRLEKRYGSSWSTYLDEVSGNAIVWLREGDTAEFRCRALNSKYMYGGWSDSFEVEEVDLQRPASTAVVDQRFTVGSATISWSGVDDEGIELYEIYLKSELDVEWSLWLTDTVANSAVFTGTEGLSYQFKSQATDLVGHRENWSPEGEAETTFFRSKMPVVLNDNREVVVTADGLFASDNLATVDGGFGYYDLYVSGGEMGTTLDVVVEGYAPLIVPTDQISNHIYLLPENNQLSNGSFDTGDFSSWAVQGPTFINLVPGGYTAELAPSVSKVAAISQTVALLTDWNPTLSYLYYVSDTMSGGGVELWLHRELSPTAVLLHEISTATAGWQHQWFDLSAYSGEKISVQFMNVATTGSVWLDQIAVASWETAIIDSVTPLQWEEGMTETVVISGSNFHDSIYLFLNDVDYSASLDRISSERLELDITGLLAGEYELSVRNQLNPVTNYGETLTVAAEQEAKLLLPALFNGYPDMKQAVFNKYGDWSFAGYDNQHSGYTPLQTGGAEHQLVWQKTANYLEGISVSDGIAVVNIRKGSGAGIYAYDNRTGVALWEKVLPNYYSINPVVISRGIVYVQQLNHSYSSYLIALDLYSGVEIWRAPFSAQWERYTAPIVENGQLFVGGGYYGGLYSFDAQTGKLLWFKGVAQRDEWSPSYFDGYLYTTNGDALRAHSLSTGEVIQSVAAGSPVATPIIDATAKIVILPIYNGYFGISLDKQQVVWTITGTVSYQGIPAVADGVLYLLAGPEKVEARDSATGELIWDYDNGGTDLFVGQPVITANRIYVATKYKVFVIDRTTHSLVDTISNGGESIAVADGHLYIVNRSGTVYAYRIEAP